MSDPERIELDAGREIAVHQLPSGNHGKGDRTIVFCHAAPGSGAFDPDPEVTRQRGISIVAPDRPGYGQSPPVGSGEWSSVDRAAEDVAAIVERLGSGPVGTVGWSAGGRVALALAARHPDLVDRVVVIATPAPDEEVPWIPPPQRAGIEAIRDLPPDEAHAALTEQLTPIVPADPRSPDALALLGAGEVDQAAISDEGARVRLLDMLDEAFVQGAAGMVADIAGYTLRPWGFSPEDVAAPTLLVYGSDDKIASPRHGAWWQQHLPNARLETVPGTGHLVVIPAWSRVLSYLAPAVATAR